MLIASPHLQFSFLCFVFVAVDVIFQLPAPAACCHISTPNMVSLFGKLNQRDSFFIIIAFGNFFKIRATEKSSIQSVSY